MNKFKEKDSFDSPYKHCLSEIKCVDTNNEDDNFTTPKVTKRITKTIKKQVKKKPKCKSQRIDTMFRKAQNSINDLDVNPDHIQMAIALSKSTLDQENPEESKRVNAEDSQHTFGQSYDQKLGNMLERYGFKSTSSFKSGTVLNQEKGFQKKKYPRFAYSLFSTTKEDRDNLIEKKISAILSQCQTNLENGTVGSNIFSNLLKNHHVKQSKLVKVHSFDINEEVSKYYTINLNLPRTNSSCGCLLKDWKVIPGRELSPIRGEQNPEDLLNDGSRKSTFGLENTNSSESLERRLTYSSSNEQFQSEQASLCETYKENRSSDRTNECSLEKTKKNNCFLDIREKNNTEINVGIGSNQIETFNSESHNSFSSSTSDSIAGIKKLNSTCHGQQLDISIDNTNLTTEPKKYDISFINEQKLSKSINKEENKQSSEPRAYCCSPDLFSSDDDNDFGNTKFQASPETNSNQKGIEYFESFSADSCTLSQEMYKSSNQYNSVSHEMVESAPRNDDQKQNDKVIEVLDSDEESVIVANEESKQSQRTNEYHTEETCCQLKSNRTSCEDNGVSYRKDLSNMNIVELGSKKSESYTTDNESYAEIKLTISDLDPISNETKDREKMENPTLQNQELDIKKSKQQNSRSPLNCISNNLTANTDFDIPRCSSTSKVCSPSFNSNSKLNVTDYIENMLGEDYITDKDLGNEQMNKEISLSQSSSDSIIISDEELNCTKIQHSTTEACCDFEELDDNDQGIKEEAEDKEGINAENDNKSRYETQKKSETFTDSFDRLLQNSKILDDLDNIACGPITNIQSSTESKVVQNKNGTKQDTASVTPKNKLIIKTRDVTPMPDYDQMSSTEIVEELKKFRVKPLKRQRGITMLKYIYECTHPMIPTNDKYTDEEEENRIFKKRRKNDSEASYSKDSKTEIKCVDIVCKNEITECENPEDLIFERKFRAKVAYCRIPLQIVWYNFVQSNPELRKNILLYEPLHLNSVYAMLKEQSNCKFHIEDFITFLDKKSITFRTS